MWNDKEKQRAYNLKYRLENKERLKKLQDDYYAKNRLKRIKSARDYNIKNRELINKKRTTIRHTPIGRLKSIISSAKTRKIDFFLTNNEAVDIMSKPCFYCGDSIPVGIDRIDSNLGYTIENSVACCSMCNYMKKDFTQKDFIEQCKKISSHIK